MADSYILKIQGEGTIHYEVNLALPPIGEGGMGRVYRAVQINDQTGVQRDVAVKFLKEDLPASMIERSRREASIRLHHDNLVEMIDFVELHQTDPYGRTIVRLHVVSEYLHGVLLADLLEGKLTAADGQPVPYAEELYRTYQTNRKSFVVDIGKKITSAIMALHDAGYIHRDIDPSNVMVTSDNRVKVIDFGIARALKQLEREHSLTTVGNFLGKAAYAAPELVHGDLRHQNATTDIYAICILLFQLLTGHLPFDGPTQEVMEKQCYEPLLLHEIDDPALRAIIEKGTQKQQSQRYQSAAELRVALEKAMTTAAPKPFKRPYAASNTDDKAHHPNPYATTIMEGGGDTGTVMVENVEETTTPIEQPSFWSQLSIPSLIICAILGLVIGAVVALVF